MIQNKALSLLGLATKAGKTVSGEFSTEKSVKSGKGYVVLVAGDSSDNTKKKFRNMCAYYQVPLFILIVGIIYLVEVASVMIQVTYFKKTGGKRFFKMAPIHHHFELCGWSETRVVAVFSIITALLCLIALMGV